MVTTGKIISVSLFLHERSRGELDLAPCTGRLFRNPGYVIAAIFIYQ